MNNKDAINRLYDKTFRKNLTQNPKLYLNEIYGKDADESLDYIVYTSTKEILYVVIPYINDEIDIGQLSEVNAAGSSTAGTVGTFGSVTTTAGSVGTVLTAASVK
jgi:hypothetical protein